MCEVCVFPLPVPVARQSRLRMRVCLGFLTSHEPTSEMLPRLARLPPGVAALVSSVRCYYARPALPTPLASVQAALRGQHAALGAPLNQHELPQKSSARRSGFLLMKNFCGKSLTTEYFRYCMARRWPYIAVAKDGASIHVDLRSVAGPARFANESAVEKVRSALQGVLDKGKWDVQLVNEGSLEEQARRVTPGPLEGSNAGKVRDTRAADVFALLTSCRADALELAAALNSAFIAETGAPTREQLQTELLVRVAAKGAARRQQMLRRLTRLAADPVASRNLRVKAGVLDGFIRASKAGPVS